MMGREQVRIYAQQRSWCCWRTIPLLGHRGCDFDAFGTSDDTEPGAWLARYLEEGDRR